MNEYAEDLVKRINAAYGAADRAVTVNGRSVKSWSSEPAKLWGTGSVSVDVRTKSGNGITQIWVKPGQTATVEIN